MSLLKSPTLLLSAYDPWRVQLAAARLEAEAIPHEVRDTSLIGVNWALAQAVGGAKLYVELEDRLRAAALLGLLDDADGEAAAEDAQGPCKRCGGLDAGQQHAAGGRFGLAGRMLWGLLGIMLVGVPLLFKRGKRPPS